MPAASSASTAPEGRRPVRVWAAPVPTGRAGLGWGASNRAGLRRCSSLVPVTGHWIQRAVVAMCVSGANCRPWDAQAPRRLPHCRAKRTWTHFWNCSTKVANLPVWYGQTNPQEAPHLLPLPVQPSLCASSVLPAAGSLCPGITPTADHPTQSESIVCAPPSAPWVCVLRPPLWVSCLCLFSLRLSVPSFLGLRLYVDVGISVHLLLKGPCSPSCYNHFSDLKLNLLWDATRHLVPEGQ